VEAALLAELGRFEMRGLHTPQPGRGELLVRVVASGACESDVPIEPLARGLRSHRNGGGHATNRWRS
jgi:Zn-dependent alcohol dehydrogenase